MTEPGWLAENESLARMLDHVMPGLSRRRALLFAAAACRQGWPELKDTEAEAIRALEAVADEGAGEAELALAHAWQSGSCRFPRPGIAIGTVAGSRMLARRLTEPPMTAAQRSFRCSLLREIVGNPFRPVEYKVAQVPAVKAAIEKAFKRPAEVFVRGADPKFLTPTVIALAEAAYAEPRRARCGRCKGEGRVPSYTGMYRLGSDSCPDCRGTGTTTDGLLDPCRLAVLADALEEAGATDEPLLRHLRGWGPCPKCYCSDKEGYVRRHGPHGPGYYPCDVCRAGDDPRRPGSRWVQLPGPHTRGCFALDAVTGKE